NNNDNNDDFVLELSGSDDFYSEDSDSDSEEFLDQRIQCLSEFKLVWTDTAMIEQKKAPYISNSITTHYRKYGPQESFTVVAKVTSSLFNFFKPMKDLAKDKLVVDLTDNNNILASIKDNNNALISAKDDNNVLVSTKSNNNALVGTKDDNNTFVDARDDDSLAGIKDDDLLAKGDSETGFLDNWNVEINSLNLMETLYQELEESVDNDIQNNNDCDFNQKLQN
ncbi:13279_t:CDS:2, partial [Funneliformis mosseae]